MICKNLLTAVKQLADSEIELIKTINDSEKINTKNIKNTMSMTDKERLKKSAKPFNVSINLKKKVYKKRFHNNY